MAQLLIAGAMSAAGSAAISGTILGMTGAQLGWMAGSLLASQIFKPDPQEGPRIEDKKVTSTIYGQPVPYVWGTDRCKAQVMWASDLIEASEDVGGKGGGGATMYSYSVNLLLAVCRSPYGEARTALRIWANGRLLATWNGMTWEVDEELLHRSRIRQYDGNVSQMPDPVYEAAVGTEDAVAYRGQLTIALEGLQLAFSGNRVPNFEVEVTSEVTVEDCPSTPMLTTDPVFPNIFTYGGSQKRFSAAYDPQRRRYFVLTSDGDTKQIEVYTIRAGAAPVLLRVIPLALHSEPTRYYGGTVIDPENRVLWITFGTNDPFRGFDGPPLAARIDLDSLVVQYSKSALSSFTEPGGGQCSPTFVCPSILRMWGTSDYQAPSTSGGDSRTAGTGAFYGSMLRIHPGSGLPEGEISWGIDGSAIINYRYHRLRNGQATLIHVAPCPSCFSYTTPTGMGWSEGASIGASNWLSDVLYVPRPPDDEWLGGINYQIRWGSGEGWSRVTMIDDESATIVTGATRTFGAGTTAVFSHSRRKVFVIDNKHVATIDLGPNGDPVAFTGDFAEVSELGAGYQRSVWSEHHDALVQIGHGTLGTTIRVVDPETNTLLAGPCQYEWSNVEDGQWSAISEVGGGWFVAVGSDGTSSPDRVVMFAAPGSTAYGGGVMLGKIVDDVCGWVGLVTDTTALTDIVDGYTVARQAAARGIIDPLRQAWFFYGVESGQSFVWRKRGQTEVMTIQAGDLGARMFSETVSEPPPPYEIEHPDETDPPRRLTVEFIDATANYDPGTQTASREASGAIAETRINLPIVMSVDHASMVSWVSLLLAHAGARPIKFALPHAYEALEPGDALLVPVGGEMHRVVINDRNSARPLLEIAAVIEDPAAWDAAFPGIPRGMPPRQTHPAELNPTVLELLDIPPLREEDNRLIAYAAASREYGNSWPGATVFRSSDGGASYMPQFSVPNEATMGYLVSTLPAWTDGNIWDRRNKIRVWLRYGTLSSATELAVLNGANAAVIGSEIVQFANATMVGEDLWEMDLLLRHRIGTEWASINHGPNTRFVLLSYATLRAMEYPAADIGTERLYKAITHGQAVAEGAAVPFTAAGNSVRPLAPVSLRGERDSSDSLSVTWIRRNRIHAEWKDNSDIPLDEPSEIYRVAVSDLAGTTIKRDTTVTTPAWTYTDVDQITDFGSVQPEIRIAVCQITPTYNGFGHYAEGIL